MEREFKWYIMVSLILCGIRTNSAQKIYNIESVCRSAGVYDVNSDITVYLRGGYISGGIFGHTCSITLRAKQHDHILSFAEPLNSLSCNGALVEIIFGSITKKYACDTLASGKFSTQTRQAEIRLSLPSNNAAFGQFQLQITSGITPVDPALSSSSSVSVGLIIGAVVGVCVFLFLICIIGVCMHKKMSRAKAHAMMYNASQTRDRLEIDMTPNKNVGFTNNYSSNGEPSPVAKTKLLNGYDENTQESPNSNRRANRPDTLSFRNAYNKPKPTANIAGNKAVDKNYVDDGDDTYYNMDEDQIQQPNRPKTPVTPILSGLHSNPKFRKSYTENERDAEDRAKRISYSTSNDSIHQRPALPKVPVTVKTTKVNKSMSMRKATRPDSFGDLSSSTPASDEIEEERRNHDRREKPMHSLKPNRKRSPEQERKQTNKMKDQRLNDLKNEEENERATGMFQKQSSIRSSKGSRKSPRLGKSTKGFGHRRTGSRGDDAISIGSRTDLESLPPLQRSSSKTSLYASRSSLYSRRRGSGRGERLESCADSLASYAHDDIDCYRRSRRSYNDYDDDFGGYEKPISRNDRLRMSRSDHDLGRAMKEISTQTLRETATQTGHEECVVVHTKRIVKRRPRSRSLSAMGTQTQKKERTRRRSKSKEDLATTDDEQTEKKKPEIKPKPKSKPKPKPRKSLTSVDNAVQSDNEILKRKRSKKRSKSDAHKAKSMEDITQNSVKEPAVPEPQIPHQVHHSHTVPSNLRNYGPPGDIPVPPPYTTLPHGAQPAQYVTSQGQSVFIQGQGQPIVVQGQPLTVQGHPVMNGQQSVRHQQPHNPQNPVISGNRSMAHAPRQQKKSNWDTLLELTEKQKAGIPTDTESIISSVFTSNPPPTYMPGQPGYYPYQQGYNQQLVQQLPIQQQPVQHIQEQYVQAQPSIQYPPSQGWPLPPKSYQNESEKSSSGTTGSSSSTSGMYVGSTSPPQSQGKSSWDRLKEMTDQQYKIAYTSEKADQNESVV